MVTGLPAAKFEPLATTPDFALPDAGDSDRTGGGGGGGDSTVSRPFPLTTLPARLPRRPAGAVAVMVEVPGRTPVASPVDPSDAAPDEVVQVTRLVTSSVLKSDISPVAVNCWL